MISKSAKTKNEQTGFWLKNIDRVRDEIIILDQLLGRPEIANWKPDMRVMIEDDTLSVQIDLDTGDIRIKEGYVQVILMQHQSRFDQEELWKDVNLADPNWAEEVIEFMVEQYKTCHKEMI